MTGLKRAKWMLGMVVFGLVVSGVTVWPALRELKWAVGIASVSYTHLTLPTN